MLWGPSFQSLVFGKMQFTDAGGTSLKMTEKSTINGVFEDIG